jgi:hypothetical protein
MRTSETTVTSTYSIIIPEDTVARADAYLKALRVCRSQPGALLRDRLRGADLRVVTVQDLFGMLFDTKQPQIFAEMAVAGDGSDWSLTELGLLGDISVAVPVTIFDDGNHSAPTPHVPPFSGMLTQAATRLLDRARPRLRTVRRSLPRSTRRYFDPYIECENFRREIHGISFMVRPLKIPGNRAKSQLCRPVAYAEKGDDFSDCSLYSVVAWDHVSWPGNDFFGGSRATDDGVKAAATSSMSVLTGVAGEYDPARGRYQPPPPYSNWGAVVNDGLRRGDLRLWKAPAVWQSVGRA